MPTVVVLGMHRSGTSMVASMLSSMGVDMGVNLVGSHVSQPFGHFEDLDFVRMNNEILADGGGTWDNPPDAVDWQKFRPEVAMLVTLKQNPELAEREPREGDRWGWKDPRTCLTAACYHQYLDQPHYVVVARGLDDTLDSLEWREGKAGDRWENLAQHYRKQSNWFIENVDAPKIKLRYENILSDPEHEAQRLADFLGLDVGNAASVVRRPAVHTRNTDCLNEPQLNALIQVSHMFPKPNIVHLGDEDEQLRDACKVVVPGARFTHIRPEWDNAWNEIHGQVHLVLVGNERQPGDVQRWAAKVRPGGSVVGLQLKYSHDWPSTAWQHTSYSSVNGKFNHHWQRYDRKPFLEAGDSFGTIGIGVPYFKAEYDFFRWWSWMLIRGLNDGDQFLNDESVMAPLPIPLVHNRLMARFLETDRDTLCIVEDDHTADVNTLHEMRRKRANHDYDIVCANYVNRREFPSLTGYGLGGKAATGEIICVLNWDETSKTGTEPVDGAAMGMVLIRRWVLDAMLNGGKPSETFWCEWIGGNSQDIVFYWKARQVGAKAAVDRDANIGHIAKTVRTVDDFWEARKR